MKNYFDVQGKVAYITGASAGLGVQFAKCLAEQGCKLALTARRVEKLEQVKKEIEELGAECFVARCDVTDPESVKEAVAAIKEHYGRIDILVNTAGIASSFPTEELPYDAWDSVIKTNLYGTFHCTQEVGKIMIEQKYGKIINLGSIHSMVAMEYVPILPYCSSKGGVLMMTKELAVEWAPYNITVNAIGPAYFASEMTDQLVTDDGFLQLINANCPMKRIGKDGELNGLLLYFASDASSYTTGTYVPVDGGWTCK